MNDTSRKIMPDGPPKHGAMLVNRPYEEIRVGDAATLRRELSINDVKTFAVLSGDINPTHVDEGFARRYGDGRLMAHALWSGALFSSLLGNELPGPGTRYISQELHFERAVAAGETLEATVTVVDKLADRVVVLGCLCTDAAGTVVATGTARVEAPGDKIALPRPDVGDVAIQTHDKFELLVESARKLPAISTAVVYPCSEAALTAASEAAAIGLIVPVLVGPTSRLSEIATAAGIDVSSFRWVEAETPQEAADIGVQLVRSGEADALMKGSLHTDELLAAVVRRETGLRTAQRLSHVFLMDVPTYAKALLVTDAAINIAPTVDEKRDICQNAIELAHILGIACPKVAILSAMETVNSRIPSTMDAAILCKMADRGQITGAVLDGPLAMDNAISRDAALAKGITSMVAGDADILLVPDLESGNILAKQLSFLANADAAGIVLGARVPIILTSRADSVRARMTSCAVAVMIVAARRAARSVA
jgi:phosphate acetyltransferase